MHILNFVLYHNSDVSFFFFFFTLLIIFIDVLWHTMHRHSNVSLSNNTDECNSCKSLVSHFYSFNFLYSCSGSRFFLLFIAEESIGEENALMRQKSILKNKKKKQRTKNRGKQKKNSISALCKWIPSRSFAFNRN